MVRCSGGDEGNRSDKVSIRFIINTIPKRRAIQSDGSSFWWNVCVINRTRKSLNCIIFQAAFYIFTRNILGTQCGVSCVKSDGVVVVVQIYSINKDANEALPLYLAVSGKIPEVLQKSKNMRQLKSRLFSLLFSQLLLKLCLFSFALFKSFRDSINRTSFFKSDPQIFNGFLSFPNCCCQSLDRKVLAVILTCGNDFFGDDLDAFRSEELGTGISDLGSISVLATIFLSHLLSLTPLQQ